MSRTNGLWLIVGAIGYCLLPWYSLDDPFWSFEWISTYSDAYTAPALLQVILYGKAYLLAPAIAMLVIGGLLLAPMSTIVRAKATGLAAASGLILSALQGLSVVRNGPRFLSGLFEALGGASGQIGLGAGALVVLLALLFVLTTSISSMGKGRGDAFIVGLIGLIITLVGIFVFFPVIHILIRAFEIDDGSWSLTAFFPRFFSANIWGLGCLTGGSCGPAINSVILGVLTGAGTTLLGLAFALIFTRTDFKAKKLLRILTIIPIITPPFVIGLALILLFGRSGTITQLMADMLGIEPARWIYGFGGIYLAQLLSFTPIAFLVLIGVVEGISPSMEEASQTLNANRWQTFRYVSLPLMRPRPRQRLSARLH